MFRGASVFRPLARLGSSTRGLATLKDSKVPLDPVNNIQKITQSIKTALAQREVQIRQCLVELAPPLPTEIPRAIGDGIKLFTRSNWRNLTVREAWLNTLVTTEVICWFFVGECIGKGNLIGYQV